MGPVEILELREPLHQNCPTCLKVTFAHFDDPNDVSGVSSWLRRLLPALRENEFDVSVQLLGFGKEPGANARYLSDLGIPVRFALRSVAMSGSVRQCVKWLCEDPPDVYVPNCILGAYYAGGWARQQGIPTVGVLHSDDSFHSGLIDAFVRGEEPWRLSAVVPVSKALENRLHSAGDTGLKVRRIGYGTCLPSQLQRAATPAGVFRVVYVGRLVEEQKRILAVTRALCEAAQQHATVEAWLVGDGPQREAVAQLIAEAGMGSRVLLKGRVEPEAIHEVLPECHALVLLSDYEGLPISVMEAMAIGVVPICLDCGSGISELIEHGKEGLIVPDRDQGFLNAVADLVHDTALWQRLSTSAQAKVRDEFSHEVMVKKWEELLNELAGGKGRPSRLLRPAGALKLPPQNPKFGGHDMRPSRWEQAVSGARIWLGSKRQTLLARRSER
jgi:colanic acid/amylovoran biosynthesis glycosyltransferase